MIGSEGERLSCAQYITQPYPLRHQSPLAPVGTLISGFAAALLIFTGVNSAFAAAKTWNGSAGTDWNTAANWTPAGIPGTGDDVTCTNGNANYPILSTPANTAVKSVTLNS